LTLFSQLELAEACHRALQSEGRDKLRRALMGLGGREVSSIVPTGTGKTAIDAVEDMRRRLAKQSQGFVPCWGQRQMSETPPRTRH